MSSSVARGGDNDDRGAERPLSTPAIHRQDHCVTEEITMASRRGRLILLACVLSSGAVFLDGTVVNIALFRIGDDLNAGFSTLQWVVDAYLLALCALVLIGGSLGDLFGRRRIFITGIAMFAVTSAACGL